VLSNSLVNEARLGFNRIHITFIPIANLSSTDYGINNGTSLMPQINIAGGTLEFGGVSGEPNGRGDYTAVLSDSLNWVRGKHSIKLGGEYRRINNNNFTYSPGSFTFSSITAFINDQATGFAANPSNQASRIYGNALGFFVQDSYRVLPNFMVVAGLRYDWNSTPTEGAGRFVVFDPTTRSLVPSTQPFNQSLSFEPRLGFSWDVFGHGKTVIRAAYALQTDQPKTSLVAGLASNPPNAFPVSFSPTPATPFVTFSNAFALAGGSVSPTSIARNYKDAYVQSWNFNIQQQLSSSLSVMAGYFANKGTDLNIGRNYNQFIGGARPYPALSANSPIFPGRPLANITVYESGGNSTYNALWLTATKRMAKGLQFNTSYTWSKSIDYNSRNVQGVAVQDSYNLRGDRGLSDYDARHRLVLNGLYNLPFHGNRLVEGWELATILTLQSGNPVTFFTSNRSLTGSGNIRASATGPVQVGYSPAPNGNATYVAYVQNPTVFYDQGNAFGNVGRNVVIGPGFSNLDFAIIKNVKLREHLTWQVRGDAFDILNHANLGQPGGTVGTSTFGQITNTRWPTGDSGSSRQLQVAMKLTF
jgi:hypothetical protein